MKTYHKIQTVFKRDPETQYRTLLEGEFYIPEFEYLKNNDWVFTEKVDGTNIRIMWDGNTITYGGKTDKAELHQDLLKQLHNLFDDKIELFKEAFVNTTDNPTEMCFYGEGYGAGIQKGGYNYQSYKDFILFDIKIGEFWLQRADVEDIATKLNIDVVPVIGSGTLADLVTTVNRGIMSQWGNFKAEGVVARPATELRTRNGKRIITKLKYKDFSGVK